MKIFLVLTLAVAAYAQKTANTDCLFPCILLLKPVCANDGTSYPNECAMRGAACQKGEALVAVRQGNCPEDTNKRCFIPCPKILKPVCGSDGKWYANECEMRGASCNSGKAIIVVRPASRDQNKPSCEECAIPCTKEYNPVCGSDGKTHATECIMRLNACRSKKAIIVLHPGQCRQ